MSNKAVILAGGLGTRLQPFTQVIPKPLVPIGEKAILEIQIERLKSHGFEDIYVATNYMSDYIENFLGDGSRYGVSLVISKEKQPLGTVGPLTLLRKHLTSPFLVMNGDILTALDFSKFYEHAFSRSALLTVGIKKMITPYDFGNIFFQDELVTGIEEKPDIVTYVLAGVYFMRPEILEVIPDGEYFGMDALIKQMLREHTPIAKYEIEEFWLDIGRMDDYQKAQEAYVKHFK
jgi:NDP-mannose synthase